MAIEEVGQFSSRPARDGCRYPGTRTPVAESGPVLSPTPDRRVAAQMRFGANTEPVRARCIAGLRPKFRGLGGRPSTSEGALKMMICRAATYSRYAKSKAATARPAKPALVSAKTASSAPRAYGTGNSNAWPVELSSLMIATDANATAPRSYTFL